MKRLNHKLFIPKNKEKYKGNVKQIIARSSWEWAFLRFCDESPMIKSFASEEIVIPYFFIYDRKWHRYFPDFFLELITGDKYIIEIKPFIQRIIRKKANSEETITFLKNQCKWEAALKVAKENHIHFLVLDEFDLKQIGLRIPINNNYLKNKLLFESTNPLGQSVNKLISPLLNLK